MKKLINAVDAVLRESLDGFAAAHAGLVKVAHAPTYVVRADAPVAGKVALISGGGSGHEPLHAGFVGRGMLDAACPGEVFTSPTPDQMVAAAEAVDGGAGLLFIVKNYSGDVMNFEMAAEMLPGAPATVLTNDDVAVEGSTYTTGRRGVAGTVIVEKIVGAAAEAGAELAACKALGDRVNAATGSMGVALTSCTVPAAGKPTFELGEDEMEMGVGIHGEPGPQARQARYGRRHRRGDDRRDLPGARAQARPAGPAAGQRLRRHAADGALPHVPRGPAAVRRTRPRGRALAGRQLHDLARDGGRLADADPPRRRADPALGRARCTQRGSAGAADRTGPALSSSVRAVVPLPPLE